ncbi:MAG: hypothetical protein EXS27_10920 [Pedosphaera sp.]|nr:hypothetical protein [Pedosphaera sp.]
MKTTPTLFLLTVLLAFPSGCKTSLPTDSTSVKSPWNSFSEAKSSYDQIVPHQTTEVDLKKLGYDPFVNPGIKMLNCLDVMQRFVPNNSVRMEMVATEVRKLIETREGYSAYELDLNYTKSERCGNALADALSFSRKTKEPGWNFRAIIVTNNNVVVYKIWSGQPCIERYEDKARPLGPLQTLDDIRPPIPI